MVPPLPPPPSEPERTTPLLPTAGLDAESVFDLPYAVDDPASLPPPPTAPLPPPPSPALPPTFSAPGRATTPPARPTPPPPHSRTAATSTAPLPAPIDAGRLAGSEAYDDEDGFAEGGSALPPMVAKGDWSAPAPPYGSGADPAPLPRREPASSEADAPFAGVASATGTVAPTVDPFAPASAQAAPGPPPGTAVDPVPVPTDGAPSPSLVRRLSRGERAAKAVSQRSETSSPLPGAPAPALSFSPDTEVTRPVPMAPPPPSPFSEPPRTGAAPAYAPGSSPTFATIQPLAPSPDPRQLRGPATVVSETRISDGLLVAAAAATVAGLIWWAIVALTQRQFVYVAVVLGMLVGQAGLVGGRRGSIGLGIVAATVTLLALTATQYFISRSLAISELGVDLPLWDGTSTFVDMTRTSFEEDPVTGLFVVGAAVIAGFVAGTPGRRASGALGEVRVPRAPDRVL